MSLIDNFLKLYWNVEYEDKMTMSKARDILIGIRVWSALASFIYLLITDNAKCVTEPVPTCASFSPGNYVWFLIQNLILYGVCVFVTIYVLKTFLRLQSTVVPAVNLPLHCQIQPSSSNQRNTNQSVRLEDLEENITEEHQEQEREVPSVSRVSQRRIIQRLNSNPNIFIKVPPPTLQAPAPTCFIPPPLAPLAGHLGKAKKVLKATLKAGCFVFLLLPMSIIHTYIYFSGASCSQDESLLLAVRIGAICSRGGTALVYMIVVYTKLYKISQM